MKHYLVQRLSQAIVVVWLAYTVIFVAVHSLPSDPVTLFLSRDATVDPETIATMQAQYGYDKPLLVQYFNQLGGILTGDLGYSLVAGQTVVQRLADVLPSTLQLAASALVLTFVLSLVLVVGANLPRSATVRAFFANLPAFFISIPIFWLGLLALQLFSIHLGWVSLFPDGSVATLALPVLVMAIHLSAPLTQVLNKSLDGVYEQPFVDVLRAKGASEAWIFFRHALKNAATSALTVLGNITGLTIAGAVVIEMVFSRAGLGQLILNSVTQQDIPLLQGIVILTSIVFVLINLIVDLLYPTLDPRITKSGSTGAQRALAV